ncbi:MAG: DNA-processing protein DprA [Candidatus Calescibacterium sp.]|nr:DNA-protecting protein DprA [Candidatus Calescibacterium sp.]MDW8132321.1 DNA-processing protein DprA [Candidatus Calescibacterium sp.]
MIEKKLLLLYLYFGYNFFKLRNLIEKNFKDNLEKTIDLLFQKLEINEDEIIKRYNFDFNLESYKGRIKFFFDRDFPDFLYENNAGIIFYNGNWGLLDKGIFRISIVGSRKPLTVTSKFTNDVIKILSSLGNVVIVSGLAAGVDTICLREALLNKMKSVAILGNGIDYYYPYMNRSLQQKIAADGLVFSEYLPKQRPNKYFFPYRNRLISCVSEVIIVIQASKNSGSLITGNYALEMGKTLIVPYLQNSEEFEGSKELINSGGIMITKPSEVLNFLPFVSNNVVAYKENYDSDYQVLEIIKNQPGIKIEKISNILNIPLPKTVEIITNLEIEGKVYTDFNYSVFIIE